ncbi:ion transporter [Sediminivirga luteola]|jgi:voltage-gated sodium channel|uniref:Ion transport domain-containing protein n=1 Tax=Sediminivirga luteola TaxID=1774748 RepID=A0A8J2U0M7_9MICO|nr:ion transporter [Sediminivirga luteola]GGA25187.1 hypothetical protein GCM10011333_30230 [Sediminivirga luteola]
MTAAGSAPRRTVRGRVTALVESARFQTFIIGVILINAVILGVETYEGLPAGVTRSLGWLNHVAVGIFVVEIALRIYAHRGRFFRDPWGWFDMLIVAVALIPATAGGEVFRVLRALRILRLLSTVRSMRMVVGALLASLPGIASISGLLLMVMYIYAVITTSLFAPAEPYRDLGMAFASLFRLLLGDGWSDVVVPVATTPWAWLLFISYSVITTVIVLNLLIAVAVEAMERFKERERAGTAEGGAAELSSGTDGMLGDGRDAGDAELLAEVRALRAQLHRLESRLDAAVNVPSQLAHEAGMTPPASRAGTAYEGSPSPASRHDGPGEHGSVGDEFRSQSGPAHPGSR